MATVNCLDRRKAFLLTPLVHILSASLNFEDSKHSCMVGKRYSRGVLIGGGSQDVIKTGGSL